MASKKGLLKSMLNKGPSAMSTRKAIVKSVIGKTMPKTMKGRLAVTGGSPFKLDNGLGPNVPNSATLNTDSILSGNGANLGKKKVF